VTVTFLPLADAVTSAMTSVAWSSGSGRPAAEGIGLVVGCGTPSGVVSSRSGGAGPDLRRDPGGRREAGTTPSCRTMLCGRAVALMDASGTMKA
jgi:hypothetical protein